MRGTVNVGGADHPSVSAAHSLDEAVDHVLSVGAERLRAHSSRLVKAAWAYSSADAAGTRAISSAAQGIWGPVPAPGPRRGGD